MMREVVMTQRMPPGRIDTHVGKKISNANGLTVAEQQTLIDWIDQCQAHWRPGPSHN